MGKIRVEIEWDNVITITAIGIETALMNDYMCDGIKVTALPPETHAGEKDTVEERLEALENLHEDADNWMHESRPHFPKPKAGLPTCGSCGGKQVYIRGKHPQEENRLVCPTCCQERLEMIEVYASKDYGKAYLAHQSLK